MSREILVHEPNNKMIKEYQVYLREYIDQGCVLLKLPLNLDYIRLHVGLDQEDVEEDAIEEESEEESDHPEDENSDEDSLPEASQEKK